MKKDYQIQHSFLFEEVRLVEGGYKKKIKKYDGEGYSLVIRFSKIMKLNKREEMKKIIGSVPLSLFPPLLLLDVWPKEGKGYIIDYARLLLQCVLNLFWKSGIYPLVALDDERKQW